MSYAIMTDTTSNLPLSQITARGIEAIPFPYFMEGKECTCTDIEAFDSEAYCGLIRKGVRVNTSQINPNRYEEYMEPILKSGRDILFLGLSSGISGSFASAQIAASDLSARYPERKISLVDTLGAGLGEGLLVLKAADYRDAGMSIEDAQQQLLRDRPCLCQIFFVDDLMHLRRTGRLSGLNAAVGSVLGIKPLLKGNREGKIVPCGKRRGKRMMIRALAEKYAALVKNPARVAITYTESREDAETLATLLNESCPPKELLIVKHEPVTASHLGPGALALFFEGNEQVRDA